MEEEGPCELVFVNPETNHFSVFDSKRLIFKKSWQASAYLMTVPKPPKGLLWLKVFFKTNPDEVTSNAACIDFQQLLDEITGVSERGPKYVALLRTKDKVLCKPFIEPAFFGSRDKLLSEFIKLFGSPKDAEVLALRWKDADLEKYNALPLWYDIQSDKK